MSKRVLILLAIGLAAIAAAFLFLKYELTRQEPEDDIEPETIQDPNRFKKGYRYDRVTKTWVPVEPKPEKDPYPGMNDPEIVGSGPSDDVKKDKDGGNE